MTRTLLLLPLLTACGAAALEAPALDQDAAPHRSMGFGGIAKAELEQTVVDGEASPVAAKLVRTGSASVVVESFEPFERDLQTWLSAHGGFVSDSQLSHDEGSVSWGSLELRVPAEDFDTLLNWAGERVQVERTCSPCPPPSLVVAV